MVIIKKIFERFGNQVSGQKGPGQLKKEAELPLAEITDGQLLEKIAKSANQYQSAKRQVLVIGYLEQTGSLSRKFHAENTRHDKFVLNREPEIMADLLWEFQRRVGMEGLDEHPRLDPLNREFSILNSVEKRDIAIVSEIIAPQRPLPIQLQNQDRRPANQNGALPWRSFH
jgi:hypothetical protein